jgi:iron complex transport system ATP-binding protein
VINVKNLSFSYDKSTEVIDGISFELKPGKVYVLLGLNGCGKTTLIKLLVGILKPQSGTIAYDGKPLETIPYKERAKYFSYVSQLTNKIDDYLVKDYLSFALASRLKFYEEPKERDFKIVAEYANKFGIERFLKKKLGEVSGGERQLISICGAFIQSSSTILMDEPTSALDLKNQNLVMSKLIEMAKQEKKAIILSTHNPNQALFLNSEVFLLKDGKILNFGPAKELLTIEQLKEIYGDGICFSSELPYKEISFRRQ